MPHHTANYNTSLHDHGHCTLRHQSRSPTRRATLRSEIRRQTRVVDDACLNLACVNQEEQLHVALAYRIAQAKRSHCAPTALPPPPAAVRRREVVKHTDPDPARIGHHHGKRTVQLSEIYIWRPIQLAHHIGGVTARLTNSPAPDVQGRLDHLRKSSSVFKIVSTGGLLKIAGTLPLFTIASTVALFSAHVRPVTTAPTSARLPRHVTPQIKLVTRRANSHPERVSTDLGKTEGASDDLISAILMACPCAQYLCTATRLRGFPDPQHASSTN